MSNTRKPIPDVKLITDEQWDQLWDQLCTPPPIDDSGPSYPRIHVTHSRRRQPLVDWVLVACWAFALFGLFVPWARGVQVLVSDFYAWCREVL